MARTFNLILTGNTLPGHERVEVARNLAGLIRIPEQQALGLLGGHETVVKRGLDGLTLHRYLEALHKAGVETRKEEIAAQADDSRPAMIRCPACATEQPDLTICRNCGTNIAALLAARAAAARDPPRRPQINPAPAQPSENAEEVPRYRRSRIFEILLFLCVSLLWGFLAMTDRTRGVGMRIFGGATFALFGTLIVLGFTTDLGADVDERKLHEALIYTAAVVDVAGNYAVANQRLAERTVSIDLPANRPDTIEAVDIGPGGRIRVTFGASLKKAPGGFVEFTPVVENGVIQWSCRSDAIPKGYMRNCD